MQGHDIEVGENIKMVARRFLSSGMSLVETSKRMDVLVKSAAWQGVDIATLDEYYLIEQSFANTGETHDYYAYLMEDGRAVLQGGSNETYSYLSQELYDALNAIYLNISVQEMPQSLVDQIFNSHRIRYYNSQLVQGFAGMIAPNGSYHSWYLNRDADLSVFCKENMTATF